MPGTVFCASLFDKRDTNRVKEMHLTVRQRQLLDGMSNGCFARTGRSRKHDERAHTHS